MNCEFCGCSTFTELGILGTRWYHRCRGCGMDSSEPVNIEECFVFAGNFAIENKVEVPYVQLCDFC